MQNQQFSSLQQEIAGANTLRLSGVGTFSFPHRVFKANVSLLTSSPTQSVHAKKREEEKQEISGNINYSCVD